MSKFVTDDPWGEIAKDLKTPRGPVTAIVSYIGSAGDALMPLCKGDKLVCDASDAAVKLGLTNAKTLQRFQAKGVEIYGIRGLHAKIVVGDDFAWVGSANASSSGLIDATVRLGKTAAAPARAWARQQCIEPNQLTPQDLKQLAAIPPPKRDMSPRAIQPKETLADIDNLVLVPLGSAASVEAIKAHDKEIGELKATGRLPKGAARWRWIEWSKEDAELHTGRWIIPINFGRPSRPGRVERVSQHPNFNIIWYRQISTPRVAKKAELESIVPGWWEWDECEALIIPRRRSRERILDLYK